MLAAASPKYVANATITSMAGTQSDRSGTRKGTQGTSASMCQVMRDGFRPILNGPPGPADVSTACSCNALVKSMVTAMPTVVTGMSDDGSLWSETQTISAVPDPAYRPPADCCVECIITAADVQILYWPIETAGANNLSTVNQSTITAAPPALPSSSYVDENGMTFVSPSVYVAYRKLGAVNNCPAFGPKYFGKGDARDITLGYPPEHLSTSKCYGQPGGFQIYTAINYTELQYPSGPETQGTCQYRIGASGTPRGPILSLPTNIKDVHPSWKTCNVAFEGSFDPPSALRRATAMVAPTPPPVKDPPAAPSPEIRPANPQPTAIPAPVDPGTSGQDPAPAPPQPGKPDAPNSDPAAGDGGPRVVADPGSSGPANGDPGASSDAGSSGPVNGKLGTSDAGSGDPGASADPGTSGPANGNSGAPPGNSGPADSDPGVPVNLGNSGSTNGNPGNSGPVSGNPGASANPGSSGPVIGDPGAVAGPESPGPANSDSGASPGNSAPANGNAGASPNSGSSGSGNSNPVAPANPGSPGSGNSDPVAPANTPGSPNSGNTPGSVGVPPEGSSPEDTQPINGNSATTPGTGQPVIGGPGPASDTTPGGQSGNAPPPNSVIADGNTIVRNPNGDVVVGSSTVAPGNTVQIANAPLSVGADNVVFGSSTYALPSAPTAGAVLIGNSPIVKAADGGVVIGSATFAAGIQTKAAGQVISIGSSQAVVDGITYALPSSAGAVVQAVSAPSPVLVADQSIVRAPNGGIVIGSSTIAPGAQATIAGHAVSVGPSAAVVDGTTYALPTTPGSVLQQAPNLAQNLGLSSKVTLANGAVITAGGNPATVDGTIIAIPSGGSRLIVNGKTVSPPTAIPSSIFTVAGQTFTASPTGFLLNGQTITPKGPAITLSGTPISLGPSGLQIGTSTIPLQPTPPSVFTVAGQTFTASPTGFVLNGQTITPNGPAITLSGTVVSLGPSGLQIGTSTIPLATAVQTAGSSEGLGGLIMGGLGATPTGAGGNGSAPLGFTGTGSKVGADGLMRWWMALMMGVGVLLGLYWI